MEALLAASGEGEGEGGAGEEAPAERVLPLLLLVVVVVFLEGVEGGRGEDGVAVEGLGEAPRSARPKAREAALPSDEAGEPG